jgi:isoleucyl-tRNA synthetase
VEPWPVIRDHGADALRWYLYTASPPGNPRRFSQDLVGEALRRFLLTLWNTYSFFVTYALIDRFQPPPAAGPPGRAAVWPTSADGQGAPVEPSELDRWLLSELHRLVERVTNDLEGYRPTEAGRAIQAFVDDLSNWYVRRSRRRFWKSEDDADKRAAYDTLYRCLVTLCHLLAPFTPFLAEEMYQNLVCSVDGSAPDSVHLASWPEADPAHEVDERLAEDMRLVMRIVSLGRAARSKAGVKVRQPLSTLYVKLRSRAEAESLSRLQALLADELNVKSISVIESEEEFLGYEVKPDLSVMGPRYGGQVGAIQEALRRADPASVARAVASGAPLHIDGWELTAEDVLVSSVDREGYASAEEAAYVVVVATELTPELADEGLAREVVHRLQSMRRNAGFEIAHRIVTYYQGGEALRRVMQRFADYVRQETLSLELVESEPPSGAHVETHTLDGQEVTLAVRRRA